MRFAEAWYLLLLVPFALVWLAMARRRVWKAPELPVSSVGFLPSSGGIRVRLARIQGAFLPLATFLLLIAAARPQAGREMREVVSEGIDILLAIDVSGSMRCEDFRPQNRLYVAKEVAKEFLRGREQDRIGLIAFAGRSELISPLTLDYEDSPRSSTDSTSECSPTAPPWKRHRAGGAPAADAKGRVACYPAHDASQPVPDP